MHFIGLDIGFSQRSRTNAIAIVDGDRFEVTRMSVAERDLALENLRSIDAIAIDAPIVSTNCSPATLREVERTFSRGPFQKRCKPGMSHIRGTGQTLREHGGRSAAAVARHVRVVAITLHAPYSDRLLVEAFPNAFLGVLLDETTYATASRFKRGKKFDWMYDRWIETNKFDELMTRSLLPPKVGERMRVEKDHEKRAALVCLVTAALAHAGSAAFVGDSAGGYFTLPPLDAWAPWAAAAKEWKNQ